MGNKCKITIIIFLCFIIIIAISGVAIYFVIENSVNRHDERCVIRYLYDQNMLRDVMFEEDPSSIPFDDCNDAITKVRKRIRNEIRIPCNLHDNKEFIGELEDLGMLSGIFHRINKTKMAIGTKQNIAVKIRNKCDGMRNMNE